MGRPERQLDPAAGPVQRFAFELRKLRQGSGGTSYRLLARRAHYSATALSDAAAGEKLPSLSVTLAYVRACGGDRAEWEARWKAVAAELTDTGDSGELDRGSPAEAPYPGLATFQPQDADRFFGREELTAELVERLRQAPLLAVFGPSGSGKSSLLRAGLVPAVRAGSLSDDGEQGPVLLMTPGEHPLRELAAQLAAVQGVAAGAVYAGLAADPHHCDLALRQLLVNRTPHVRFLLIVDQFEEVFTLCRDDRQRETFLAALLSSVDASQPRARVVLGVRADFYARCARHPQLAAALRDAQVLVGPMGADQLRRAVVEPARRARVQVEPALVAAAVADGLGRPGALPLLSHALLETWRRRRGPAMTLAGYEASGGVAGAVARTAEHVYGKLEPPQQAAARRVLLRLTALGEDTEDTRRRASLAEILDDIGEVDGGRDGSSAPGVLRRLADARLISVGADTVEVTHEALIGQWPRLRGWLTEDRDGLRLHRRLTEAAVEWEASGRDEAFLYRGARLAAWHARPLSDVNRLERAFLEASRRQHERDQALARRRVRLALISLTTALAVISGLTVIATVQRNQARDQRDVARSRQLASTAMAQLPIDAELSLLLARRAWQIQPTAEAEAALRQALTNSRLRARLTGHDGPVNAVSYSPDSARLASAGTDGTVRIWAADGQGGRILGRLPGEVTDVRFSPDGATVAASGADGSIALWDVAGSAHRTLARRTAKVTGVAFSPDGSRLAAAASDGTIGLWPVTGSYPPLLGRQPEPITDVSFRPDGRAVATAGADGTVRAWAVTDLRPRILTRHPAAPTSLTYSPDGARLAVAGTDETVRILVADTGAQMQVFRRHDGVVSAVTFSRDGREVASAGNDGTVRIWDPDSSTELEVLRGQRSAVLGVSFAAHGGSLASASRDGSVRIWDWAAGALLRDHDGAVGALAFTPDGRRVVTGDASGAVRIWSPRSPGPSGGPLAYSVRRLSGHRGPVNTIAISRDGQRVASGGADATVRLWDAITGAPAGVLRGHAGGVFAVAFDPHLRYLASAGEDRTIRLWDAATGHQDQVLRGHDGPILGVSWDRGGNRLASAGGDDTVRVWDLSRTPHPQILRGHEGPVLGVQFSPVEDQLASAGNDGTTRLWNLADGASRVLTGHEGPVYRVRFHRDGRHVLTAGNDRTARLWDLDRRADPIIFTGHLDEVNEAVVSPDGRYLASASDDGTVRIRPCDACEPIGDLVTLAERRSTRDLTAAEHGQFLHQR